MQARLENTVLQGASLHCGLNYSIFSWNEPWQSSRLLPHSITKSRITWSRGGKGNNRRCLSSFCTGLLNPAALIVTGTSTISELKANKKLQDRITGKHPRPSRANGGTWMSCERNTNISVKHRRCRTILSFIYSFIYLFIYFFWGGGWKITHVDRQWVMFSGLEK